MTTVHVEGGSGQQPAYGPGLRTRPARPGSANWPAPASG